MSDELRFHIEQQTAANMAAGMAPEEARRRARLQLGAAEGVKAECREERSGFALESWWTDVRYVLRGLRKSPGFTAVAVLTLALGIGANTAIFSMVHGVLIAPLPFAQPDRLVMVWENNRIFPRDAISYANFLDWQRAAHSFEQMSVVMVDQGFNLTAPGEPEHLNGNRVSSGFFSTLGARLSEGREISPVEDTPGGARVAIISDRLWRNRFGGSSRALGKSVTLDGIAYMIVGVLPPEFRFFLNEADIFVPIAQFNPLILNARGSHDDTLSIARLRAGVGISQAQSEMNAIQDRLDRTYPDADQGLGIFVEPLKQVIVGDVRGMLLLFLGAVGLVLLIACANVANLLLARSAARSREFAVRAALGASRARIVRHLLTESVLLSLAGAAVGVLVASIVSRTILSAYLENLPRRDSVGMDAAVLLFTVGVSLAVGILFGLVPSFRYSNATLDSALRNGGRGATARQPLQSALVIAQMALTLVLLVGAGLLFRTIQRLWQVDPGFAAQHLLIFKASLSPSATKTGASIRSGFQQMMERIRSIPGVQAADFTMLVPLTQDDNEAPFWIDSQKPAVPQNAPRMVVFDTGPDYLRTMGIPLLQGRFFTVEDTTKSPCVGVIDSVLAQTFFPGKNPVGQTMTFGWPASPWGPCAIIGVVGHVNHWGLGEPGANTKAQSYYPMLQASDKLWPLAYSNLEIVVRTELDAASVIPEIKSAVYGTGEAEPIYNVRTMQQIVSDSMSSQRFPMALLGIFAVLALLLAAIGTYGVVSNSVARRAHEIGIRMALGAEAQNIFRLIVGQGLRLALAGLAIGTAAALVLTRAVASFSRLLYGVSASDVTTFVAVSVLMVFVTLLACYVPARRAMRVDPMVALRYE